MVYWAPILHFYQPPTQFPSVLKKICNESYRPLIRLLGEFEHAKATVNINGSLTEMLLDCGHDDIIAGLKELAGSRAPEGLKCSPKRLEYAARPNGDAEAVGSADGTRANQR